MIGAITVAATTVVIALPDRSVSPKFGNHLSFVLFVFSWANSLGSFCFHSFFHIVAFCQSENQAVDMRVLFDNLADLLCP